MSNFYLKISRIILDKVLTLIFCLIFIAGCATSGTQSLPQQVKQVQSQQKQGELQGKLLSQLGQGSLTNYRDYPVGPEDLLEVSFLGIEDLKRVVRVNGQGEITMPLVGVVKVSAMSPQQIEDKLIKLYKEGEYINAAQISVLVKEYHHQQVMVTGAVAHPGPYEMIGPRTLLEMLGKAGSLNEKAGDMVHVIRSQSASDRTKILKGTQKDSFSPGTETIVLDLRRLLLYGDVKLNIPIKNGDIIHVPNAQNAYVMGAVNKPGPVPVKENLTVGQAVAMAGGTNPLLSSDKISVIRFDDQGNQMNIPVNFDSLVKGSETDIHVSANDIVYVHESAMNRFLFNFKQLIPFSFGAAAPIL